MLPGNVSSCRGLQQKETTTGRWQVKLHVHVLYSVHVQCTCLGGKSFLQHHSLVSFTLVYFIYTVLYMPELQLLLSSQAKVVAIDTTCVSLCLHFAAAAHHCGEYSQLLLHCKCKHIQYLLDQWDCTHQLMIEYLLITLALCSSGKLIDYTWSNAHIIAASLKVKLKGQFPFVRLTWKHLIHRCGGTHGRQGIRCIVIGWLFLVRRRQSHNGCYPKEKQPRPRKHPLASTCHLGNLRAACRQK